MSSLLLYAKFYVQFHFFILEFPRKRKKSRYFILLYFIFIHYFFYFRGNDACELGEEACKSCDYNFLLLIYFEIQKRKLEEKSQRYMNCVECIIKIVRLIIIGCNHHKGHKYQKYLVIHYFVIKFILDFKYLDFSVLLKLFSIALTSWVLKTQ